MTSSDSIASGRHTRACRTTDFYKVRKTGPHAHRTMDPDAESYSTSKSLLFAGSVIAAAGSDKVGNSALIFPPAMVSDWYESGMSFDVRFALLPASDGISQQYGGIVFGGQDTHHTNPQMGKLRYETNEFEAYVRVDCDGNLFCMDQRVGDKLAPFVWYHIVVSMSTHHDYCTYLNGQLVSDDRKGGYVGVSPLVKFMQIGTGFFKGDWVGFNGIINEFRVWQGTLRGRHVQLLQLGNEKAVLEDLEKTEVRTYSSEDRYEAKFDAECLWSLQDETSLRVYGDVGVVHCTLSSTSGCLEVRKSGLIRRILRRVFRRIPILGELLTHFEHVNGPVSVGDLRYEDMWAYRPRS